MTDAFDDEGEQAVTIHEYLKEVEDRELEADLVLGGDDGKECTYNNGYMKRQAIFSCLTCTPDGNAGVCTACSLACHDGHQVVELWTKRNFRCDCGNAKFGEFYCKLFANKDIENVENSYNHNFKGSYCTCGRPYPDPDAEEQEEMIQCCLCEDWFHEEHLGLESSDEIPRDEEGEPLYEDFICKACSEVCSFLSLYPEAIRAAGKQPDADMKGSQDKVVSGDMPSASGSEISKGNICSRSSPEIEASEAKADSEPVSGEKNPLQGENCANSAVLRAAGKQPDADMKSSQDKVVSEDMPSASGSEISKSNICSRSSLEIEASEAKADSEPVSGEKNPLQGENCANSAVLNPCTKDSNLLTNCLLGVNIADAPPSTDSKPTFLSKNWRDALCKCEKCLEYYNQKKIAFLADREDSIVEYEKMGKQKREEKMQQQEGAELSFFNKLGHVEKVEILKGIEEMKDGLRAFLDSADSSKPITADDIHQFFDDIQNKRRRVQ